MTVALVLSEGVFILVMPLVSLLGLVSNLLLKITSKKVTESGLMLHFALLKQVPLLSYIEQIDCITSWSLSSFPYMKMSLCIARTPRHWATISSILIWKISWLIFKPNGTHRNLYHPKCVLKVIRSDVFFVRCIPKKALLPSTLENLVALWECAWSLLVLEPYDSLWWLFCLGPWGWDIFSTSHWSS